VSPLPLSQLNVCVRECVREREREKEKRVCVVLNRVASAVESGQCLCEKERKRESVCVSERESVCERWRESVCMCVCVCCRIVSPLPLSQLNVCV